MINDIDHDALLYIIPQDPETMEDILSIDRKTKEDLRQRHRLFINSDWECNTIAEVTITSVVKIMYSHILNNGVKILADGADTVDFYDLISLSATYRKNKDADKTGNLNIKFSMGRGVPAIISDDGTDEERRNEFADPKVRYSEEEDEAFAKVMEKIDTIARRQCKDKYAIVLPNSMNAIAVTYVFIENMYRYIVTKLVRSGKASVMINFNDIIEFIAMKTDDDSIDIKLRPGMGAKLAIKSDYSTESDEDDDD